MAWAAVRSKAVVLLLLTFLFILTSIVGVCNYYMFRCTLLYVHSCFAIILMEKRELVALLSLSSWCLLVAVWLFLTVPWVCLLVAIVVFPDHTHLLFLVLTKSDWEAQLVGCILELVHFYYEQTRFRGGSLPLKR